MNRAIAMTMTILVLHVSAAGIVHAQGEDRREATKVLAGTVAGLIEKGDLRGALTQLQTPKRPLVMLGAADLLIRHYYWQKKNLPVVVALARCALIYGRNWAEGESDEELRKQVLSFVKATAYNLASFTWPGWGQEGIVIRGADREEGVRAAELNLRLAKSLEKGPQALSAAHWIIGAHQLTAGDPESAVLSFKRARGYSEKAGDAAGALMNRGYMGIALALSGQSSMGLATVRSAISQLEAEGSDDAKFYAGQVRDVYLRLVGPASMQGGSLTRVECGPVILEVAISDTAMLFHVVDQLSAWSPLCHPEYRRFLDLTAEEEAALKRYRELRQGKDIKFSAYFYTRDSMDDALFAAAEKGLLDPAEVHVLSKIFARFAPRLKELREEYAADFLKFTEALKADRVAEAATQFSKFTGVETLEIEVYPVPKPGREVGVQRAEGAVAIEIPRDVDAATAMIHEMAREFLRQKKGVVADAAEKTPGLSVEILTESICFAFAEGLHHGTDADPLAESVAKHHEKGAVVRTYGLALRPVLAEALSNSNLDDFLKMARISWRALLDRQQKERGK